MTDRLAQLGPGEARGDYLPQAVVRCDPDALARSKEVRFAADEDDLGGFRAAFLRLRRDGAGAEEPPLDVLLQRYAGEPAGQLTVFLGAEIAANGDVGRALDRVLAALGLGAADLLWRRGAKAEAVGGGL